ncbi:MAG: HAD-IA family hydrolase [Phenylobacterium sp.]|uniref:HAD-IA family hydrolase n=1 Tax=Phenylobacterium sp. TaxID=1871053 RepID=UPI0027365DB2|nr:HAD-IA family hydrolase [Phenylobacterium sp.]MDP3745644.1 HAD-IA family hydrolase [Phenylobacterium sp.]
MVIREMLQSAAHDVFADLGREILTKRPLGRPLIVFISGVDASGKTRFAERLAGRLGELGERVEVIHVDDFHRPRSERYQREQAAPADAYYCDSFDIQHLKTEILEPIRREGALVASHLHLDLVTDEMSVRRDYNISPESIVVLEGVFLMRPELDGLWDVFIHIDVPLKTALDRAIVRDGDRLGKVTVERYATKYFAAQARYLAVSRATARADIRVDNSDYAAPRIARSRRPEGPDEPPLWGAETRLFKGDGPPREFDAVCFDLWNTLVPFPDTLKREAFAKTVELIGLPEARLAPVWAEHRQSRETGDLGRHLRSLLTDLQVRNAEEVSAEVMRHRSEIHGRAYRVLDSDAEITLRILRGAGFRLAVVSNCTSDVPEMLAGSALGGLFDARLFSSSVGLLKPDPRIFRLAAERLGVTPERCLYVGDGDDSELEGAASIGMTCVMLDTGRPRTWKGPKVSRLSDILGPILPGFERGSASSRVGPSPDGAQTVAQF